MKQLYFTRACIAFVFTLFVSFSLNAQVFISEIHYDDAGGDSNEGVEVTGPAGTDLSGFEIIAYNGNGGASYITTSLSGVIGDEGNGYGAIFFSISGLQNGAPDGVALIDNSVLIEFLSYEGNFTASNGVASGIMSTDIMVSESGSTPDGHSLKLTDAGWQSASASSYNLINTGLTLGQGPVPSVGFDTNNSSTTETDSPFTVDIPVTLSNYDGNPVVLDVTVGAGGTAEPGDYVLLTPSLSFNTDETKMVTVEIQNDADMDNETIELVLTENSSTGINISTALHTIVVSDDDIPTYDIVINEILADPGSVNDANNDGISSSTEDEFIEFYNFGSTSIDISNWEVHDNNGLKFTFPSGTNIASGEYIVVFAGGSPNLPGITTFTTTGGLQLNNGGDDIQLFDSAGSLVLQVIYGSIANDDQSIARSPDVTGVFMKHNDIVTNPVSFSPGLSNITAVLPIELLKFTAGKVDREVILKWSTASELNNDYMEIERAIDGVQFEALGRVIGAGTSSVVNHYELTDENPFEGVNYYRLKQVDFDGTITYSNTLSVEFGDASKNFLIYPNPGKQGDQLTIVGEITPDTKIELVDQTGRVVLEQQIYRPEDRVHLNLSSVQAGLYAVRFIQGQRVHVQKFILN